MNHQGTPAVRVESSKEGPHLNLIRPPAAFSHADARLARALSELIAEHGTTRVTAFIESAARAARSRRPR